MADEPKRSMTVEYRVRPITRYQVTRYESCQQAGTLSQLGTYDNEQIAYEVGYALCKAEHDRLGLPLGDDRIIYPEPTYLGAPQAA